ncbi:hypothetical protein SFBSU_008G15, partial [Candidatus Arthromitus sp. SFB-mouse-SU]
RGTVATGRVETGVLKVARGSRNNRIERRKEQDSNYWDRNV